MTAEEWAALLRGQRHSFLNHLQVISGWLQLGNIPRAQQYLISVAARLEAQGTIGRAEPPELALVLLQVAHVAETYNVGLEWDVRVPVPVPVKADELRFLQRRLMGEVEGAARRGVRLGIHVSEADAGLLVHTYDIPTDPAGA